ncbi:YcaO-like family protein [Labrys okinawensis]|uniref:YcaO-like family protein n=1 Tax=Labrys okinawensis TaxID=346911 RepID=UPI0039BC8B2A
MTNREEASAEPASFSFPLEPFGITRVGDLTSLDTIGIPVWFAVRPNSRTLSVSQGKGLTHEQARISAIMESVEGAVAQQTRPLINTFGSLRQMMERGAPIIPLRNMSRCKFTSLDLGKERAWVPGFDQETGETVLAPYELVGLDMRSSFPWDYRGFKVCSNGLAAGPSLSFAALAALLELIERHANSLVELIGVNSIYARPLRYEPDLHQGLDEAVGKVRAAGLEPRFFELACDIALPVVAAVVTRPVLGGSGGGERLSGGHACRLDAGDAALAALLEAVQSRLTNISGARDDMDASQYEVAPSVDLPVKDGAPLLSSCMKKYARNMSLTKDEQLSVVIKELCKSGYGKIFFFDLPTGVAGVHVVRALVPRLKVAFEDDISQFQADDIDTLLRGWSSRL